MADFKKFNGYNVKDGSALAHASVSGTTLTTTDRNGNTVDNIELPGGLALSATHMSYWPKNLTKAYAASISNIFMNSNEGADDNAHYSLGQVLGSEMIGYGEIEWDDSEARFTLSGIRAVTTHGWQNFARDMNAYSSGTNKASFRNNLLRQFRPLNYKAYLNVGMLNKSITIPAGSSYTILKATQVLDVKEPAGYVNGFASIAKAIPTFTTNAAGAGLQLYFGSPNGSAVTNILAYNPTSSDITLYSFVLELDAILYNDYAERIYVDAPNIPFIEGINCTSLTNGSDIVENTSVIVKHHTNVSGYYLHEFKLTLDDSTGTWSWVRTTYNALGPGPAPDTYHNELFTFSHEIMSSDYTNLQNYTSAVAYALASTGSASIGVNHYFTDGIPIPSWLNIS